MAIVSRLARAVEAGAWSEPTIESIWNVNEPRPFENCDAVDRPKKCLVGVWGESWDGDDFGDAVESGDFGVC